MSGMTDSNLTDAYDQAQVVLMGGTDNTKIGNDGDKLKTTAEVNFPSSQFPSVDYHLRLDDMNATNGGVTRGTSITTSWTTIYSYTGSGHVFSFFINPANSSGYKFRLIIDGYDIFGANGILNTDADSGSAYDLLDVDVDIHMASIFVWNNSISWNFPVPISYSSSVVIRMATASGTGTFRSGLIKLTKY